MFHFLYRLSSGKTIEVGQQDLRNSTVLIRAKNEIKKYPIRSDSTGNLYFVFNDETCYFRMTERIQSESELLTAINKKEKEIAQAQEDIYRLRCQLLERKTGYRQGEKVSIQPTGQTGILAFGKDPEVWSWRRFTRNNLLSNKVLPLIGDFNRI